MTNTCTCKAEHWQPHKADCPAYKPRGTNERTELTRLREIAQVIGSRPVMGHWPALRAELDSCLVTWGADELERQRAEIRSLDQANGGALREIERLRAEVKGLPKARKCLASATSDPPQDCDAPFCGCDPAWSACIEMLQECNLLVNRPAPEPAKQQLSSLEWQHLIKTKDDEIERLQKDRNECLEAFHILFRIFPEPK